MNGPRLTARDYKGARRGGPDLRRWREFGIGLGLGLLVALVVYVGDHRRGESAATDPAAARDGAGTAGASGANGRTARKVATRSEPDPGAEAAASGAGDYSFYNMLPQFEVVVPEKERGTRVDASTQVSRPGTYFLQAGSYRNQADAERVRTQLARQDISANVQRVALDADVWFRIRVGPIKDLAVLNRTRQQLKAADIDSLVVRVED